MSENNLLTVKDLCLSFGGLSVLNGVSFEVEDGTICALIGPNGSGKTSILNCINRFYTQDKGTIIFHGHDISKATSQQVAKSGVARTFQNMALFEGMSVLENIKVGRHMAMKSGLISGGIYVGKARREEIRERQFIKEEIIEILKLESIRDTIVGILPYEYALDYAVKRTQFNKPIATFQRVQDKLVDMAMNIEAARMLVYKGTAMADNNIRGSECNLMASYAKLFSSEICMKATTEAVQILGGYGYIKEYPVERMMRDAKIMTIGGGTSEIQRMIIIKHLMKSTPL